MSFLDTLKAIFSGKKPIETIELSFSHIDAFVAQHAGKIKDIEQRAKQHKQDLMLKFKNMRVLLDKLKQAKPSEYISTSKICVVAESIREKYYQNSARVIAALPEGIQDFKVESQNAFKVLNLDMRKADILLTVYKAEMSEFSKALVNLKKELDVFNKFVKRELIIIKKYDELQELIINAKDRKDSIAKAEVDLGKIKKELDFLKSKKQNVIKQLDNLQESKNSSEVQELSKEAKALEDKNKQSLSEVDEKFSEIRKLLKKFKYLVNQELYSANQRAINEYIKSPSQALISDFKLNIIAILTELQTAIGKDITLDEKQQKQVEKAISELTEDYFKKKQDNHKVTHGLLQENYSQKTQILTPLVFKERALEREANALDRNLEQIQKDYDKQDKILNKLKEQLVNQYQNLGNLVSEVTELPVQIS